MFSQSIVTLLVELAGQLPLLPFPLLSSGSPFLAPVTTLAVHDRERMKAYFTQEDLLSSGMISCTLADRYQNSEGTLVNFSTLKMKALLECWYLFTKLHAVKLNLTFP